ncbi:nucleoside hydrolase [Coleofasciculus sp. FACHB-1120]|uniref:nucleoside hydrolase n=1 Tax=Coleofasciculus sp. FACHB-1120 TaxID=2692783 RepID=UPI001682E4CA|nr:nucleoside hydrolase [Coleofasciculus sp. FACHB-1120]MBD2740620.1 nucleoside hydrolase [Coleofasciculus sp. FACHB-1120]
MPKQLVLMDHDGGVDDYLATMLLMTMDGIQPLGIVVTPADCYVQPAVSATCKILDLMGRSEVPVAESTVRGINPFPRLFRRDSFVVDHLPILNERETIQTPLVPETGQEFMVRSLQAAPAPVTLMVTGPLTTVATALDMAPEIEGKIEKIVWMGGALNVPGNVSRDIEPGQDGSAEWNVYWDPISANQVWQTSIPIVLCPLDLTNNVPVTSEVVRQLGKQRRYPISDLAGQCYALVIPQDYYFWDILATAYLAHPEFYEVQEEETRIVTAGISQGRTTVEPGGRKIGVMQKVDKQQFYDYILQQWAR